MLLVQNSLLNRKTKNIYFSFFSCPFLFNASGNFNNLVDDGEGAWKQSATATGRQKQKLKAPRIFPRGFWTLTFVVLRLVLMICKRTDYKLILGNGRRSKPFFVQQKRFISLPTLICLKFFYVSIQTGAVHRSEIRRRVHPRPFSASLLLPLDCGSAPGEGEGGLLPSTHSATNGRRWPSPSRAAGGARVCGAICQAGSQDTLISAADVSYCGEDKWLGFEDLHSA